MDTLLKTSQYEAAIITLLNEYVLIPPKTEEYSRIVIADKEHRHYLLVATGWATSTRFVDTILIHLRIQPDGSVWLLENNTEIHVRDELVKLGVLYSDIVLAFHPVQYRELA